MISPTVPATQGDAPPVQVSIHPFTHGQQPPQMGEVQGRVRVQVQPQELVQDQQE